MSTPCDQLESFADGTLTPAEAQVFSEHLATCARCQAGLTGLLQLEQFGRRYLDQHGPVSVPWYTLPRNRWAAIGGAVAALAVLVLWVAGRFFGAPSPDTSALWARQTRSLEARVTYPRADVHHRLKQNRMGAEREPASDERPPAVLEALKEHRDLRQLVAVYLSIGEPDPASARKLLQAMASEKQWDSADVLCDLGVTHYVAGDDREALRLFGEALRHNPSHLQALWNRALVYRKLNLPLLAMEDFAAVERGDSDEGWRSEARDHRERLEGEVRRRERWAAAGRAGDALIARGPGAEQEALKFADIPMMRRDFYDAVRTRTSVEEVRALEPLAKRLDGMAGGGTVLAEHVQRIASRDFVRRAPLARRYAELLDGALETRELEELLQAFLTSGEEDLAIGALVYSTRRLPHYSEELVKRAKASTDPWFQLLGLQAQAAMEVRKEAYANAQKLLGEALEHCKRARLHFRCMDIENDLSHVTGWLFLIDESERHAREGWALARATGQWDKEGILLQSLGNVSRLSGDVTLGRAYYGEALRIIGRDRVGQRNIHQNLAHLAIEALDLEGARAELDRALEIGLPLTLHGVEALVDIARTRRSPMDEAALLQGVAEERGGTASQRAYAKFLEGRFYVETDAARGRALLEESIREAEAVGKEDIKAKHARAYSYTSLIFDDARRGHFETALRRFGTELGFEVPGRCVLGLTEDTERTLLVVKGADGQLWSDYQPNRKQRLPVADLSGVVPRKLVEALAPCSKVDVLARPPLQGRSGLLPPEIAWSYRTRSAPPRPPSGPGLHLVVNEVQYSDRDVPPLRWTPRTAKDVPVQTLQGLEATPSQVLAAMHGATEIDLATHGLISPGSNASYLLLARDVDGRDELREDRIREQRLTGAPLVVLAACEAARGSTALHELDSLPNAFLASGARAVLAATQKIPDEDSAAFFGSVRDHIREGRAPSIAVRDERLEWLREGKGTDWIGGILVFE